MSVDTLTDSELRTKLAEYGYPVVPVTETTRKILVKKLKNLMATRGGAGSRHSLAARYSSDDTDEEATASSNRKKKSLTTRRQTMANPMPPPAASAGPIVAAAAAIAPPRSPSGKRKTQQQTSPRSERVAATSVLSSDIYVDDPPPSSSDRSVAKNLQKRLAKASSSTTKNSRDSDGLETGSDSDINDDRSSNVPRFGASKHYDAKASEPSTDDSATTTTRAATRTMATNETRGGRVGTTGEKYGVPPFKPNISPILPITRDEPIVYKKDERRTDNILANYETPFLSDFTRRLSSARFSNVDPPMSARSTLKSSILRSSGGPEVKDGETNGHFASLGSSYSAISGTGSRYVGAITNDRSRDIVGRNLKSSISNKEDPRNGHNMISMILLMVLALFFGILAIVYLGLGGKTETLPSLPSDSDVPLCLMSDHDKPGVNCLLKENLERVIQLLEKLRPILMRKAVSSACEDIDESAYITDGEIIDSFKSNRADKLDITSDLHNAQLLIFENPKWGISLIELDDENGGPYQILDSMEKVFQTRLAGKLGMIIPKPDLPVKCLIKQKLFTVLSTVIVIALGIGISLGGHRLLLWYMKYKSSSEKEVFQLVSEIISMVELHHQNSYTTSPGGTQESYLAINHVRDNLIPPKDRKKMASLWEKAVKFLDENESRIRREVQQVAGEEFHVWRWLPNNILNTSAGLTQSPMLTKKSKVWQGQAFETMEGSVNSLACSPTPCLKIRHMFEADAEFEENWETKVQDAILEKCGEVVKILHIRVDRGSREGCVYMKCMSQEDAGKAYRALHGWWFDGKLVTVKYLRLERYHERFPDALRCITPLKPSNNERLSMQAHSRLTSLEAN